VAEPFPISSLGHGVVLPRLAGWNIHQNDKFFLTFLIATHLATAIVLLFFFLKDWVRIAKGLGRSLQQREIRADDTDARLGWLLVVGTIPAGGIGLVLEHPLRKLFASSPSAAAFLIVNGFLLLAFERLRRRLLAHRDLRLGRRRDGRCRSVGASQAPATNTCSVENLDLREGFGRSDFSRTGIDPRIHFPTEVGPTGMSGSHEVFDRAGSGPFVESATRNGPRSLSSLEEPADGDAEFTEQGG